MPHFTAGQKPPLDKVRGEDGEKRLLEQGNGQDGKTDPLGQEMAEDGENQPLEREMVEGLWQNAPRVDLVCRTFSKGLRLFWTVFFPTYLVSLNTLRYCCAIV